MITISWSVVPQISLAIWLQVYTILCSSTNKIRYEKKDRVPACLSYLRKRRHVLRLQILPLKYSCSNRSHHHLAYISM
jgi:hypothetical protein